MVAVAIIGAILASTRHAHAVEPTVFPDNRNAGRDWTKPECEKVAGKKLVVSFTKTKNIASVCVRGCHFSQMVETRTIRGADLAQATFVASGSACVR